jgi:hypothetical protein
MVLLVLPTLVALIAIPWLLWSQSAINSQNFAKIEPGMTLAEVEGIFGGPARNESTGPLTAALDKDDETLKRLFLWAETQIDRNPRDADAEFPSARMWTSDRLVACVDFDADGRVSRKNSLRVRRRHDGPLDVVRRWFGL